VLRVFSHHLY